MDDERKKVLASIARELPPDVACVRALDQYGPFIPWNRDFLTWRKQCYRAVSRSSEQAVADLIEFMGHEPLPIAIASRDGLAQSAAVER